MRNPARSLPAANASARLDTSRLLPTLGSPPTNRMPCGGNSPGSTRQGGGVEGCCSSNCASDSTAGEADFVEAASFTLYSSLILGNPPRGDGRNADGGRGLF